jgi:hypothetical protein
MFTTLSALAAAGTCLALAGIAAVWGGGTEVMCCGTYVNVFCRTFGVPMIKGLWLFECWFLCACVSRILSVNCCSDHSQWLLSPIFPAVHLSGGFFLMFFF